MSNPAATQTHGLSERDIRTITAILQKYPDVVQVYLFGSRAKGNFHAGSDIDLAIMNAEIEESTIRKLKEDFEESSLPYFVDIVHFPSLTHPELKEHVLRVGVSFYERVPLTASTPPS
jgi:uncharacterized protein